MEIFSYIDEIAVELLVAGIDALSEGCPDGTLDGCVVKVYLCFRFIFHGFTVFEALSAALALSYSGSRAQRNEQRAESNEVFKTGHIALLT